MSRAPHGPSSVRAGAARLPTFARLRLAARCAYGKEARRPGQGGNAAFFPEIRRALALAATVLPALALATSAALAAEAEHGGEAHGPDWFTLTIALLNFGALLFVLSRYALPAIQDFFFQRSEAIRKQLQEAQSRLRAAEAELEDLRRRSAGIEQESARILAEMKQQSDRERDRALQRAEHTAKRIREDAQRVADRELERALNALRAEASTLAASLAADLLRSELRPEDHTRLVDEFVARVERQAP